MSTRIVDADDAPKYVVVAAGPSECGKTRALHELFLAGLPRRLSIDFNGEVKRKYNPRAVEAFSLAELREQLAAHAGKPTWHIALCVDPETLQAMAPDLGRILNPARTSSTHRPFSKIVGGIAIDCSEARNFVPNLKSGWASHTVAMFERGRHNCLTLFMATQAPQSIERRVTDAANVLLAFRTSEKAVLGYWSDTTSDAVARMIKVLPPYHCAYIEKDAQVIYLLDAKRHSYAVVDYDGNELEDDSELCEEFDDGDRHPSGNVEGSTGAPGTDGDDVDELDELDELDDNTTEERLNPEDEA